MIDRPTEKFLLSIKDMLCPVYFLEHRHDSIEMGNTFLNSASLSEVFMEFFWEAQECVIQLQDYLAIGVVQNVCSEVYSLLN